jgi:xanthine dehydrogenase accessory factor
VHDGRNVWTNIGHAPLKEQILANLTAQEIPSSGAVTKLVENAGQRYDVLLESLRPPHALVIVGDGVSADMLARLSHQLGWSTTRVSTIQPAGQAQNHVRHVFASPHSLTTEVTFDSHTSVVVMTHRMERDLAYIAPLMATPVGYIGVIGSRQRADQVHAAFPQADHRLHVPAGLDIGSETPQEIALAIVAEILALRNDRTGGPLIRSQTSIHP